MSARVCVVTGASRGIGLAVTRRFVKRGWDVLMVARDAGKLGAAASKITGARVATLSLDVATASAGQLLIEHVRREFGRIDVLVNNAGAAPLSPIDQMSDSDYRTVMAVNVDAVFRLTRAVWPLMKQQGGGTIVNISSVSAVDPFPGFSVYGATKAWVNLFTQALGAEGAEHGIRVFAVAPGAVETELLRGLFPTLAEEHVLQPDQVAQVVEQACLPDSGYSPGQTIFVRR